MGSTTTGIAESRAGNTRGRAPRPGAATAAERRRGRSSRSRTSSTHPSRPAFPGSPSPPPVTDSPRQTSPAPASLQHHTGTETSTGGMEPARSLADLIRTSTDGNDSRPRGWGGREERELGSGGDGAPQQSTPNDTGSPEPAPVARPRLLAGTPSAVTRPRRLRAPLATNRAELSALGAGAHRRLTHSGPITAELPGNRARPTVRCGQLGWDVPSEVGWSVPPYPAPWGDPQVSPPHSRPIPPWLQPPGASPLPLTPSRRCLHAAARRHPLPPSAGLRSRPRGLAGATSNPEVAAYGEPRPLGAPQPIQP